MPGGRRTRNPSSATSISAYMPTPAMAPRKNPITGSSSNMPETDCQKPATTARWMPWECRATNCPTGMIFNSSPDNYHTPPLLDDIPVGTDIVIGPNAQKPLKLQIPLFVSDMSFGALSEPAKIALAQGAELAGTGICAGEGGMLAEEQAANSRYFYELASARVRLWLGQGRKGTSLSFQGGTRGQDRHRRTSSRRQGQRQNCPGTWATRG